MLATPIVVSAAHGTPQATSSPGSLPCFYRTISTLGSISGSPDGDGHRLAFRLTTTRSAPSAWTLELVHSFAPQMVFLQNRHHLKGRDTMNTLPPALTALALIVMLGSARAQEVTDSPGTTQVSQDESQDTSVDDEHVLDVLRARVVGGAVFFNGRPRIVRGEAADAGTPMTATIESPQFSQASPYMAFEVQPQLLPRRCERDCHPRGYPRWSVEPFANVRLTTVPVLPVGAAAITMPAEDEDGGEGAQSATNPFVTLPSELGPFVDSQKAAKVQLGGIVNFNFGGFRVGTSRFRWASGITGRVILESITDAQRNLRVWDIDDDLYNAWALGLRVSLYGRGQEQNGWTPSAYLDIARGKFESFKVPSGYNPAGDIAVATDCIEDPPGCIAAGRFPDTSDFTYYGDVDLRWYVEGRIFLRSLYFGLDVNAGAGPDDMRFSTGIALDVSAYFARRPANGS